MEFRHILDSAMIRDVIRLTRLDSDTLDHDRRVRDLAKTFSSWNGSAT